MEVAIGMENETYLADSWEEISELAEPLKEKFPAMAADAWPARAESSYQRRKDRGFFEPDPGNRTLPRA
ncbi:hypothetical protein [Streptomyces sp. NPDC058751]|uniref:hypothetical protein n=1 Tax=Streptomyces sp. NPDC058751 TaxID=3346623 RepID=UPI0036769A62